MTGQPLTFALAIVGQTEILSAFVRYLAVARAENYLLSNRIIISTFCSFTGQTFGQKVINCPAIANAWTLAVSLQTIHDREAEN